MAKSEPAAKPGCQHDFTFNNDSFITFHGGVDGLKHKVVDAHTEKKMSGSNINLRRDPLLFFPFVSLPQRLRNGLSPAQALGAIFEVLKSQRLYAEGRWTYEQTFSKTTNENAVAQFFQTIHEVAHSWADAPSHTITATWREHSLHLIEGLRKPDVILVPVGSKSDIPFKDVLTYCELKESFSGNAKKEALKQLTEIAGYATATQLNRRFYVASSLCNRFLTLATFIRGSTVISEPLNIDTEPIAFLSVILGLSAASPDWCGLDYSMTAGSSNTYGLGRPFSKFVKVTIGGVLLYAAKDMHSKGTKVPLCDVWEKFGTPPKTYPIKMSWMPTAFPGVNAKLLNDVDIANLMADRASSYPTLEGLQKRIFGKDDEYRIFSDCLVSPAEEGTPSWDYVKHWPGVVITLPEECDTPLAPCPRPDAALWKTGYYPDDYKPLMDKDTTRNILERFNVPVRIKGLRVNANWEPQSEDAAFEPPSLYGETRELIWVLYRSCGTSIVWFSCRRELVNGLLGALAGHFNTLQLKILHCDISDSNVLFKVDDNSPTAVVPDWPERESAYPKRPGMICDLGYAADLAAERTVRRITGTFPYIATDFLSPETKTSGHVVYHDLESFFWVLWVVCVNMNGPFYTRRRWRDEKGGSKNAGQSLNTAATSSSIFTDSSVSGVSSISYGSTVSNNSFTTAGAGGSLTHIGPAGTALAIPLPQTHPALPTVDPSLLQSSLSVLQKQDTFREQPWRESEETNVTTRFPLEEEEKHAPPIWATPGRHNLGPLDVFRSKRDIPESLFLDCISPYFRQSGPGFLDGLKTLHTYFVKMQGIGGEKLKQEMGEITHEKFCEILKNMRDSIPADMDRTSDGDIKKGRARYESLLRSGGSHGIAISILDSQRPKASRPKRPAEEQNEGKAPKRKASKVTKPTGGEFE